MLVPIAFGVNTAFQRNQVSLDNKRLPGIAFPDINFVPDFNAGGNTQSKDLSWHEEAMEEAIVFCIIV